MEAAHIKRISSIHIGRRNSRGGDTIACEREREREMNRWISHLSCRSWDKGGNFDRMGAVVCSLLPKCRS